MVSALAGTLIYVLVSFFGGQDGLWATSQIRQQKMLLSAHTQEIQKIHDKLYLEHTALEKDADMIKAYARKLGYVSEGEKLVKITGLSNNFADVYDTGSVKKSVQPVFVPEWFCKMFGLICGGFLFLIFLLKDLQLSVRERNKRKATIKGIPVYDLPQI